MKKIIITVFASLLFIACEGPIGPEGPEGPRGSKGEPGSGGNWYTTSITINSDEWELVGGVNELNSYFFIDKPISQLSENIYRKGTVIAYIETSKGVKNGLPYVLHKGDADNKGEFLWTQTYDFDFYPGGVGFYLTYSDFSTNIRPDTETFHIVLMW